MRHFCEYAHQIEYACYVVVIITVSRQRDKTRKQWLAFTGIETAVLTHAPLR